MRAALRAHGSALVAFSGGVDSTFVLKVAVEELGDGATLDAVVRLALRKAAK